MPQIASKISKLFRPKFIFFIKFRNIPFSKVAIGDENGLLELYTANNLSYITVHSNINYQYFFSNLNIDYALESLQSVFPNVNILTCFQHSHPLFGKKSFRLILNELIILYRNYSLISPWRYS